MKWVDGWELDEGSFESLRKVFLGTKEVGGRRKLKKKNPEGRFFKVEKEGKGKENGRNNEKRRCLELCRSRKENVWEEINGFDWD